MEVEDKIQFTDVAKIFVEDFDECMNEFKDNKFVLILIHNGDKVEGSVAFVDDFVLFVLEEVAHFGFSGDNELVDLG